MPTSRKSTGVKRRKIVTTVNFEPDALAYLQQLQREFDRDRSYILNAMVMEFRRRRSVPADMLSASHALAQALEVASPTPALSNAL
jgi:predicted transcriptional regulator